MTLGPEWTKTGRKATIPGNIRTVVLRITTWNSPQATLDDLFFSANLAKPFDVDAVMTTKFQKDGHTLLLLDFDGQGECRLQSAKLTDDKGGRFGKGVRIEARQCLHRGDSSGLEGDASGRNFGVLVPRRTTTRRRFTSSSTCSLESQEVMTFHADTSGLFRLFGRSWKAAAIRIATTCDARPKSPARGSVRDNGITSRHSGIGRRCDSIWTVRWWITRRPVLCRS